MATSRLPKKHKISSYTKNIIINNNTTATSNHCYGTDRGRVSVQFDWRSESTFTFKKPVLIFTNFLDCQSQLKAFTAFDKQMLPFRILPFSPGLGGVDKKRRVDKKGKWTKKDSEQKNEIGQKKESGQEYLVFLNLKITALFLSQLGESGQGYLATGGGPTSLLCQHKMIDWLVWITGLTRMMKPIS